MPSSKWSIFMAVLLFACNPTLNPRDLMEAFRSVPSVCEVGLAQTQVSFQVIPNEVFVANQLSQKKGEDSKRADWVRFGANETKTYLKVKCLGGDLGARFNPELVELGSENQFFRPIATLTVQKRESQKYYEFLVVFPFEINPSNTSASAYIQVMYPGLQTCEIEISSSFLKKLHIYSHEINQKN